MTKKPYWLPDATKNIKEYLNKYVGILPQANEEIATKISDIIAKSVGDISNDILIFTDGKNLICCSSDINQKNKVLLCRPNENGDVCGAHLQSIHPTLIIGDFIHWSTEILTASTTMTVEDFLRRNRSGPPQES